MIPAVIFPSLLKELRKELRLQAFEHDDVRPLTLHEFEPSFAFSLASLATFVQQQPPRLTQQADIHRSDRESINEFFNQLWSDESDVFSFHLNFLFRCGMLF